MVNTLDLLNSTFISLAILHLVKNPRIMLWILTIFLTWLSYNLERYSSLWYLRNTWDLPMAHPSIFSLSNSRRQFSCVISTFSLKSKAKNWYLNNNKSANWYLKVWYFITAWEIQKKESGKDSLHVEFGQFVARIRLAFGVLLIPGQTC